MIKTFEKWVNTDKEIKKYLVLSPTNLVRSIRESFAILKVVKKFTEHKVDKVELERVHLFDLSTGEDINDDLYDNWYYTANFLIEHMRYQSDNLQDLLDIKDMLMRSKKYNL
jgi:hypothetical protein